jgi:hypothetical protein
MTVTVAEPAEETTSIAETLRGRVPDAFRGIETDIVALPVSPGARALVDTEDNDDDHPFGTAGLKANWPGAHPPVSLLVTDTV